MTPFNGCPTCGGCRFLPGPRGGSAQNITCLGGCGARFNVNLPTVMRPGPVLLVNEIDGPSGSPPDTSDASWIIEIIDQ
jgi:hypothetical protein